jgi:hypothetical protein
MSEKPYEPVHSEGFDERTLIEREKRNSSRTTSRSTFSMTVNPGQIEGVGSNISQTGAYFVTCDEISVELLIRDDFGERIVPGRIVRIETVSEGSNGVAIQFETRLLDV